MPTARQWLTSRLMHWYPFLSGCGTAANARLVRLAAGTGGGEAWARLRGGPELLVPLDDYVGRAAYYVGDLDRKVSEVVRRIVRPGDTALDVGANLGVVAVPLGRLVGPTGAVHAFEPNPAVADYLARSLERNGLSNVRLHRHALGASEGELELSVPTANAGQGTLTPGRSIEGARKVRVPVRPLAAVAREAAFPRVRLMKIDVEGFEAEVLRGAESWLAESPPEAILFESNDRRGAGEADPVVTFLSRLGYRIYSIPKRLFRLELHAQPDPKRTVAEGHDLLAVWKDSDAEITSRFSVRA